jgi:hypothetical protein
VPSLLTALLLAAAPTPIHPLQRGCIHTSTCPEAPTTRPRRCRSMAKEFKAASMYRGRVTQDKDDAPDVSSIACRGNLLARGVEHSFALNSLQ